MKHKHYYLLLLVVATLLVSCPMDQSSPTPSKPDIVVPDEPDAPTTDVDGNVAGDEITAWKDALSALVHCYNKVEAVDDNKALYMEYRSLREVIADTDVELQDPSNTATIPVTYYKGSYMSDGGNNIEDRKMTIIADVSGKYKESGELFKMYIDVLEERHDSGESGSSTLIGTATYTEGSKTYNLDLNKMASGGQIEDKNSPEYKVNLIMGYLPSAEIFKDICKYTFTNYNHPSGYIFDGKTACVQRTKSSDLIIVSDQEYTDGTVSVTIKDDVQGDVNLIVRYDIKRDGEAQAITESSYMHVKKEGEEKFRVFPIGELTLNDTPSLPSAPVDPVEPTSVV